MSIVTTKMNSDLSLKVATVFSLSALAIMVPDLVMASDVDIIGDTLCKVVSKLQGKIGKGIATIAVVFLGIGLFLGKLSWGLAVAIGIGIGGIFGAQQIVGWMGGNDVSGGQGAGATAAC